jgi:hypothetical protein
MRVEATSPHTGLLHPVYGSALGRFSVTKFTLVLALLSLLVAARAVDLPYSHHYLLFSDIMWVCLLVLVLLRAGFGGHLKLSFPAAMHRPWIVLGLLVLVGTIVTVYFRAPGRPFMSLRLWGPGLLYGFRFALWYFSFAIAYRMFADRHQCTRAAQLMLVGCSLVCLVIAGQALGVFPEFWPERSGSPGHVGPLAPHHGHLGGYMILFAGLALQIRLGRRRILPVWFLNIVIALCALAELLGSRRSGWFALVLLFALPSSWSMRTSNSRRRIGVFWLRVFLAVAMVVLVLFHPDLRSHLDKILDWSGGALEAKGNLAFRWDAPVAYIRYFFAQDMSLLFGAGYGASSTYVNLMGGTHNQLVTWFFELGLPGLFAFLWLAWATHLVFFRAARRAGATGWVALNTIFALHVYGLGGVFIHTSMWGNFTLLYVVYLALALRLLHHEPVDLPPAPLNRAP